MSSPRNRTSPFSAVLAMIAVAALAGPSPAAKAAPPSFGDGLMDQAIGYVSILAERDFNAADRAWLKEHWTAEFQETPDAVTARLDEMAVGLERYQRDPDPIALATDRLAVVKETYCDAAQTRDPIADRLSAIIAPDDLVLAANCLLGVVVTRFDIDALVASHALTAAVAGLPHDPDTDRATIQGQITQGFDDATPAELSLIGNAELRHAVFARFWSRIEGTPEQSEVVRAMQSGAAGNLPGLSRELETLALARLGEFDHIAVNGNYRLTSGMVSTYRIWFERIAGFAFTRRDRAWLEDALVRELQSEPQLLASEVEQIAVMNRDYVLAKTDADRAAMAAGWAAGLHCLATTSSDPDERHLGEVLFRHDPVIDADCAAGRITRSRERVLTTAGSDRLVEGDLEAGFRFMAMLFGRPLSADEQAFIRDDEIRSFSEDPALWRQQAAEVHHALAEVEKHDDNVFLAMDQRQAYFDQVYCQMKVSDEPSAGAYIEMFKKGGAITSEDCQQPRVTTLGEIDAYIGIANFLNAMQGEPAPDTAEIEEARRLLASADLTHAESWLAALDEWWSLLSLEERQAGIEQVRRDAISLEATDDRAFQFMEQVKMTVIATNAKRDGCEMMAIVAKGETAIYAAQAGTTGTGRKLSWLLPTINMYSAFCS